MFNPEALAHILATIFENFCDASMTSFRGGLPPHTSSKSGLKGMNWWKTCGYQLLHSIGQCHLIQRHDLDGIENTRLGDQTSSLQDTCREDHLRKHLSR